MLSLKAEAVSVCWRLAVLDDVKQGGIGNGGIRLDRIAVGL